MTTLSFPERAFNETALGDDIDADLGRAFATLLQRRLVVLTGAGTSASPPTNHPGGTGLARRLVRWLEQTGMRQVADGVDKDDLADVAAAIEARLGRDTLIRQILLLVDWSGAAPNLCHFAIALLIAEDLLQGGFTANWDPQLGQAAETVSGLSLDCPCDVPTLNVSTAPRFIHLHGQIDHPDTLVVTVADLEKPDSLRWTEPVLQGALAQSDVALIGFAAEPEYIVQSLEAMLTALGRRPVAVISDRSIADFQAASPRLSAAAGLDANQDHYVEGQACEVLGELLRATYRSLLVEIFDEAVQQAEHVSAGRFNLSQGNKDRLSDALFGQSLSWFLNFVRQAAWLPARHPEGQPPVVPRRIQLANILGTVLLVTSADDVQAVATRENALELKLDGGRLVQVWPVLPIDQEHAGRACGNVISNGSAYTKPRDAAVPLVLACSNVYGAVPKRGHPSLIAAPNPSRVAPDLRAPADVLTLDVIENRAAALVGAPPYRFNDLVEGA